MEDKELSKEVTDEEKVRAAYEKLKSVTDEVLEIEEDNDDELRMALLDEMQQLSPFSADEFNEVLDKEFSVFKQGEEYDYVKDMKNAFQSALAKPAA